MRSKARVFSTLVPFDRCLVCYRGSCNTAAYCTRLAERDKPVQVQIVRPCVCTVWFLVHQAGILRFVCGSKPRHLFFIGGLFANHSATRSGPRTMVARSHVRLT